MTRTILTATRDLLLTLTMIGIGLVAIASLAYGLFYLSMYAVAWLVWA